jgi:hypothetical protein
MAAVWCAPDSRRIEFAGSVLQLFGLVLVWLGLRGVRETFSSESEFVAMWRWVVAVVKSFRRRDARAVLGGVEAVMAAGTLVAHGRVRGATDKHRLDLLEQEIDALRAMLQAEVSRLQSDIGVLRQDLASHAARLESEDDKLRNDLKEFAVGKGVNRHMTSIGFWWVVIATLTTFK